MNEITTTEAWESVNGTVSCPAEEPAYAWDGDKNGPERPYIIDYSQTLTMKLFMAIPDENGGSDVAIGFDEALEFIKQIDLLSLGIPKIIYLVGWNHMGHDNKYPSWEVVNPYLSSPGSTDAAADLNRLIKEARAYHTKVSLHLNSTDAYMDSPLWSTYKKNDLISRKDGEDFIIGVWNQKKAYQINYKNAWESGMYKKIVDDLLKMLPELKQSGTIHSDAFLCRRSDQSTLAEEQAARRQMIRYWRDCGIDLTTEFIFSSIGEDIDTLDGNHPLTAGLVGLMPYAWHLNQNERFWHTRPASLLAGGGGAANKNNATGLAQEDKALGFLYGRTMQGESYFTKERVKGITPGWEDIFINEFCLYTLLYLYQNKFANISVKGHGENRSLLKDGNLFAQYSEKLEDRTIYKDGILLRQGNDVFAPAVWRKEYPMVIAYSESGYTDRIWTFLPEWRDITSADIYRLTKNGPEKLTSGAAVSEERSLSLTLGANQAIAIVPENAVL
jgi:hypothetical protein